MTPPLALDIDGTLTDPEHDRIDPRLFDPRLFDPLLEWPEPIVLATGKAFPYPVALCHYLDIPIRVVAENGGVAFADGVTEILGDGEASRAVAQAYQDAGHSLGWGGVEPLNRWRETEVAVQIDQPEAPLRELAAEHGLEVVDSGYAYHVKSPDVDKGKGLEIVAAAIGVEPEDFVAIGDSENDVETFELVDRSFAVANADDAARSAADELLDDAHADGTLAVLERLREP
ncbi:HAD-superfamily hydrolase, subfamily IIB [Salinarchaeum sp. Harcht-Bsk1]|uniref:HAD hydrolase family protein n=1 Tax=Salinarchaeum sp. Harcht-Bsk1 TaxID=1333523 RepID=UPI00034246F3|nr:HAD hydrolase family protein [Salinarchaeum sp. Harcht-Bsk1]AGN02690.1 HAD-superfamily hydrolase, subfamily IIB [Salinarchaeum sp. Harcht-Bsk1]